MEEPIQNIPVAPKPNPLTTVTPMSKALALILFITLPFTGFYLGMKYQQLLVPDRSLDPIVINPIQRPSQKTNFLPTSQLSTQPATPSSTSKYDDKPIFVSQSLDKSITAELFFPQADAGAGSNNCLLKIIDSMGKEVTYSPSLLPGNTVGCDNGMGNFNSDLNGWVEGNKLVVLTTPGNIKILDPLANKASDYVYKSKELLFIAVNRNLSRWLFRRIDINDRVVFQVYDQNHNLIKDNIDFPKQNDGYSTEHYDSLNDAFLFVTEQYDGAATLKAQQEGRAVNNGYFITKFDVLKAQDLSMNNVLATNPTMLAGRGCYNETFYSEPGVIIIKSNSAGCILIADKYFDSKGELRLKIK